MWKFNLWNVFCCKRRGKRPCQVCTITETSLHFFIYLHFYVLFNFRILGFLFFDVAWFTQSHWCKLLCFYELHVLTCLARNWCERFLTFLPVFYLKPKKGGIFGVTWNIRAYWLASFNSFSRQVTPDGFHVLKMPITHTFNIIYSQNN